MKKLIWLVWGFAALAWGQDDRVTVPFSDPSGAHKLVVTGVTGSINVKGYSGKDVIVEWTFRGNPQNVRRPNVAPPPGMKRLGPGLGPAVMEMNNVVQVRPALRETDFTIQVPVDTSVRVNSMQGAIVIDGVTGETEVSNMSGPVTVTNVSGSVVAHSMSGKITASMNRVAQDKPTSFSTFNGDVEVTLPADTKANLKFRTYRGDIFSDNDFDVKLSPDTKVKGKNNGRTRVYQRDGSESGTLNGGGPEMQFTTFNGKILLHKK